MQTLNFLFSPLMIKIYLVALIFFGMYKIAQAEKQDPRNKPQEPEDIEAHLAGIDQSETPDQAIKEYSYRPGYNELRSQAFVNKMAEMHKEPTLS
jgi:hypothetical protein